MILDDIYPIAKIFLDFMKNIAPVIIFIQLSQILKAIKDQTAFLKDEDEVDSIGNT